VCLSTLGAHEYEHDDMSMSNNNSSYAQCASSELERRVAVTVADHFPRTARFMLLPATARAVSALCCPLPIRFHSRFVLH
jgi:hypothetical protein